MAITVEADVLGAVSLANRFEDSGELVESLCGVGIEADFAAEGNVPILERAVSPSAFVARSFQESFTLTK